MLNQGRDGHDEKAREEAIEAQTHDDLGERAPRLREERPKHGHAQGAERDQAVFDFVAGKIARRKTARPNPERDRRHQVGSDLPFAQLQQVFAVGVDRVLLDERAEKKEIGVPKNRQREHPIPANRAHLTP